MKHKLLQLSVVVIIFIVIFFSLEHKESTYSSQTFLLDTIVSIELLEGGSDEILQSTLALCKSYEETLSRTISSSEIAKINSSKGHTIQVSNMTAELIKIGVNYGDLSNGSFDISILPISELWDFKSTSPTLPDKNLLQMSIPHVNYSNVLVDDNTITLLDPKMKIDLGGIAKGYIADELKDYLLSEGVTSGIINLGGNVLTIGNKPDGSPFRIGINNPFEGTTDYITDVEIIDESVVTSGVYQRFFKLDNTIYHHILNPETGLPFQNDLYSATIISPNSVDGDALSTICMTLGLEEATKLIEDIDDIRGILITNKKEVHYINF